VFLGTRFLYSMGQPVLILSGRDFPWSRQVCQAAKDLIKTHDTGLVKPARRNAGNAATGAAFACFRH
jgi:hypothetical protein